jgi:cytochrome c biogenesis protein CcdA
MTSRRVASIAAVLGGIGWLVKVALVWARGGENTSAGLVGVMFVAGLVCIVVALGAGGYTLVRTAPAWLRAVVTVAVPVLVLMVWQMLDEAVKAVYTDEGWLRDELNVVLAALVAVATGAWTLTRRQPDSPGPPERPAAATHRRRATG